MPTPEAQPTPSRSWRKSFPLMLFVAFVAFSVAAFWNATGFYFWDEWDGLHLAATTPLPRTLLIPHNEHVIPLFRVYFRLATGIIGEHYGWGLLGNCAIHAANGVLLFIIMRALMLRASIAVICAATYVCCFPHWENLLSVFQVSILGYVTCSLFMLLCLLPGPPLTHRRLALGLIAGVGGAGFFGAGLLLPVISVGCLLLDRIAAWFRQRHGQLVDFRNFRRDNLMQLIAATVIASMVLLAYIRIAASNGVVSGAGPEHSQPTTLAGRAARAGMFALATCGYTPLARIVPFGQNRVPTVLAMTASAALLVVCWGLLWRTRFRLPLSKLAVFHAGTLLVLGLGRASDDIVLCASRYQAFVLIAPILTLAMVLQSLAEASPRRHRIVAALCVGLLLLIPVQARHAWRRHELWSQERGTMLRAEFNRCRALLNATPPPPDDQFMADYVHPGFTLRRLRDVVAYLAD